MSDTVVGKVLLAVLAGVQLKRMRLMFGMYFSGLLVSPTCQFIDDYYFHFFYVAFIFF